MKNLVENSVKWNVIYSYVMNYVSIHVVNVSKKMNSIRKILNPLIRKHDKQLA